MAVYRIKSSIPGSTVYDLSKGQHQPSHEPIHLTFRSPSPMLDRRRPSAFSNSSRFQFVTRYPDRILSRHRRICRLVAAVRGSDPGGHRADHGRGVHRASSRLTKENITKSEFAERRHCRTVGAADVSTPAVKASSVEDPAVLDIESRNNHQREARIGKTLSANQGSEHACLLTFDSKLE